MKFFCWLTEMLLIIGEQTNKDSANAITDLWWDSSGNFGVSFSFLLGYYIGMDKYDSFWLKCKFIVMETSLGLIDFISKFKRELESVSIHKNSVC